MLYVDYDIDDGGGGDDDDDHGDDGDDDDDDDHLVVTVILSLSLLYVLHNNRRGSVVLSSDVLQSSIVIDQLIASHIKRQLETKLKRLYHYNRHIIAEITTYTAHTMAERSKVSNIGALSV